MVVFGKDRDVFSRGDGSQAEEPLQRARSWTMKSRA